MYLPCTSKISDSSKIKGCDFLYRKSKDTFANFLIIEEPEAHIHNHIQKTLFDKLDYGDTQIIYSTHSTQISEVSNVDNINILAKKLNYAEVYQPSTGLGPESINQIQRYLDAVRTNLLFAKGVILVEGDAEEILIPIIIKKAYGVSLDELGISLINIRSTGFQNVAQLFHPNRIRRSCSILTDLDEAICDTTILPTDTARESKYKLKVEGSKKSGEERKNNLEQFIDGNPYVDVFFADHTFEVDFVKAGNAYEVGKIVKDVYTARGTLNTSKLELNSNDVALYGKRVLTMAKQQGKGWFAILLGKHITYKTIVPEYIIDAILFAKPQYAPALVANIIKYRLDKNFAEDDTFDFTACNDIIRKYTVGDADLSQVIGEINNAIDDDQIITLLNKML